MKMIKSLLQSSILNLHGGIDSSELLETCIKYNVDMKIHAFERGMEFNQVIEIVDGEIIQDKEIQFEDYQWECICPKLGS